MTVAAATQLHPRSRSRAFNRPFEGLDLRTAAGRRVRDLAIALLQRAGRPINDPIAVADAVSAAELMVKAEETRRDPKSSIEELQTVTQMANEARAQFVPQELRLT